MGPCGLLFLPWFWVLHKVSTKKEVDHHPSPFGFQKGWRKNRGTSGKCEETRWTRGGQGLYIQLFSDPGKKREPFFGKTVLVWQPPKKREKGATEQLSIITFITVHEIHHSLPAIVAAWKSASATAKCRPKECAQMPCRCKAGRIQRSIACVRCKTLGTLNFAWSALSTRMTMQLSFCCKSIIRRPI